MDFLPKIVYQDDHYLFCRKPHALASTWGQADSFLATIKEYGSRDVIWSRQMATFGQEGEYGLLNRLDTVTAGLLYMARDTDSCDRYLQAQANRCIQKIYYAKVYGTPRAVFGWIDTPIFHHREDDRRMTTDAQQGRSPQEAQTYWELAEGVPKGEFSWLRIVIHAGVRHQIRCHLASIGHPIVGDVLYMTKGLKKRYHADTVRDSIELVSAGIIWNE